MQACTKVVITSAGLITQTITGIVDRQGTAFTPKAVIIHGNSVANTLQTYYRQGGGFDNGSVTYGECSDETTTFGLKFACTGSAGDYSILDEAAALTFGGFLQRLAKVTAFRLGECDITYALNDRPGDAYQMTFLGGDDLDLSLARATSGANTVGFAPECALFKKQVLFTGHSTASGTDSSLGWATRLTDSGVMAATVVDGGVSTRYQRSNKCAAQLSGASILDERTVTAWGTSDYTLSGAGGTTYAALTLGGILAAAGTLTQPPQTGIVEYSTISAGLPDGVDPRLLLLMSYGAAAHTTVQTDMGAWAFGMADGVRQNGYWTGESIQTNTVPVGARYLSDSHVLMFPTSLSAGSTTFTATCEFVSFSSTNRSFKLNWTLVDGVSREVLWLVLGDTPTRPVPVPLPNVKSTRLWRLERFDMKTNKQERA